LKLLYKHGITPWISNISDIQKKINFFFLLTDIVSENSFWRRVLLKKVLDKLENIDFNK
jgi:hypothetical protein